MPKKTNRIKLVRASNLKLGRFIVIGTDDYQITNLNYLTEEERVIVVALPIGAKSLSFRKRREVELRLIVPLDTELIVLK